MPPAWHTIVNPEHTGPYQPPVIRQNIEPKPAGERIRSHFLVLHSECLPIIQGITEVKETQMQTARLESLEQKSENRIF